MNFAGSAAHVYAASDCPSAQRRFRGGLKCQRAFWIGLGAEGRLGFDVACGSDACFVVVAGGATAGAFVVVTAFGFDDVVLVVADEVAVVTGDAPFAFGCALASAEADGDVVDALEGDGASVSVGCGGSTDSAAGAAALTSALPRFMMANAPTTPPTTSTNATIAPTTTGAFDFGIVSRFVPLLCQLFAV